MGAPFFRSYDIISHGQLQALTSCGFGGKLMAKVCVSEVFPVYYFTFELPTRVHFGQGSLEKLAEL